MRARPKNPPRKPKSKKRPATRRTPNSNRGRSRPTQIRSPGWTADQQMDRQQESAARYNNWLNQNHANRDAAQKVPMQQLEKQSGKDLLAADLSEAKEGRPAVNQQRDAGHAPPAQGQQKDNARAAPEKHSGKDRLAADLKGAKESPSVPPQGRDGGRSR